MESKTPAYRFCFYGDVPMDQYRELCTIGKLGNVLPALTGKNVCGKCRLHLLKLNDASRSIVNKNYAIFAQKFDVSKPCELLETFNNISLHGEKSQPNIYCKHSWNVSQSYCPMCETGMSSTSRAYTTNCHLCNVTYGYMERNHPGEMWKVTDSGQKICKKCHNKLHECHMCLKVFGAGDDVVLERRDERVKCPECFIRHFEYVIGDFTKYRVEKMNDFTL